MAEFTSLNGYDVKDKKAIRFYSTVANMVADDGLKAGQKVLTSGYNAVNDGGNGEYVIVSGSLTADGGSIIALDSGLFAKLIIKDNINVKQFGCYGDGSHDDSSYIANAISYISNGNTLFFPEGTYLVTSAIKITKEITVTGPGTIKLGGAGFNAMTVTANNVTIDGLSFVNPNNYTPGTISSGDIGDAIRLKGNNYRVKNCNIDNYIAGIVFGVVNGTSEKAVIENNYIKVKGLNTGYINDGICSLGDDCVIQNNTIVSDNTQVNRGCIVVDINSPNNIIINNKCYCDGYSKVGIHSEDSAYSIIKNNLVFNPRFQGMTLSTGSLCANNYVETPTTVIPDYSLDHCAIAGYGSPSNLIIDGNIIKCQLGEKYGIRCNGTGKNNKIVNNSFIGSDGSVDTIIRTQAMTNSVVANNTASLTCNNSAISSSGARMNIVNNCIKSGSTGIRCEANDYGVIGNNIISGATSKGINVYNCENVVVHSNVIGNTDTVTPSGIAIENVGSAKQAVIVNNLIINATTNYDRVSYTGKAYVTDYKQVQLYDSTADARKTMKIDNGSVVVS